MINKFIAAAALSALSFGASATNLVTNGSFEIPGTSRGSWITPSSIPGWSSTHGIEIRNDYAGKAEDGCNFVELDTDQNSTIWQTVSGLTAGAAYTLSFWVDNRSGVSASSEGLDYTINITTKSVVGGSTPTWTEVFETFIASGSSTVLSFAATGTSDSYGTSLDNVKLTQTSAVPEPATVALMLAGLAAFGLSRRRSRQ